MATAMLDRGYVSVRDTDDGERVEIQLVDDDNYISIAFQQSPGGEMIDGEWADAPSKIVLTLSQALAQALLEKLAAQE